MTNYIFALLCVAAIVVGQILMKVVGSRTTSHWDIIADYRLLFTLGAAVSLYAASTLLWVYVLRTLPLSRAYMVMALAFVLVPLASAFVFHERISANMIVGSLLVVAGIVFANST